MPVIGTATFFTLLVISLIVVGVSATIMLRRRSRKHIMAPIDDRVDAWAWTDATISIPIGNRSRVLYYYLVWMMISYMPLILLSFFHIIVHLSSCLFLSCNQVNYFLYDYSVLKWLFVPTKVSFRSLKLLMLICGFNRCWLLAIVDACVALMYLFCRDVKKKKKMCLSGLRDCCRWQYPVFNPWCVFFLFVCFVWFFSCFLFVSCWCFAAQYIFLRVYYSQQHLVSKKKGKKKTKSKETGTDKHFPSRPASGASHSFFLSKPMDHFLILQVDDMMTDGIKDDDHYQFNRKTRIIHRLTATSYYYRNLQLFLETFPTTTATDWSQTVNLPLLHVLWDKYAFHVWWLNISIDFSQTLLFTELVCYWFIDGVMGHVVQNTHTISYFSGW